jgi:hypothetical protein
MAIVLNSLGRNERNHIVVFPDALPLFQVFRLAVATFGCCDGSHFKTNSVDCAAEARAVSKSLDIWCALTVSPESP